MDGPGHYRKAAEYAARVDTVLAEVGTAEGPLQFFPNAPTDLRLLPQLIAASQMHTALAALAAQIKTVAPGRTSAERGTWNAAVDKKTEV